MKGMAIPYRSGQVGQVPAFQISVSYYSKDCAKNYLLSKVSDEVWGMTPIRTIINGYLHITTREATKCRYHSKSIRTKQTYSRESNETRAPLLTFRKNMLVV